MFERNRVNLLACALGMFAALAVPFNSASAHKPEILGKVPFEAIVESIDGLDLIVKYKGRKLLVERVHKTKIFKGGRIVSYKVLVPGQAVLLAGTLLPGRVLVPKGILIK